MLERPLSHYWTSPSREGNVQVSGNQMFQRVHQNCCVCWQIAESLVRPLSARWEIADRSLEVRFPQDHWETVLSQFKIWLRPCWPGIEFTERSLRNHGRPWISLSAHWKTVGRSVRFCGLSMVSQRSRLCGKGQGRSYGGGGGHKFSVPPPPTKKKIMHTYFLICQYRACVNTLLPTNIMLMHS